jgi:hypothetical protein
MYIASHSQFYRSRVPFLGNFFLSRSEYLKRKQIKAERSGAQRSAAERSGAEWQHKREKK